MLQSPTTTWGVQSFTLSILEKKNRNTKQCLRGERRKLYQIQNRILQIYTPISTPLEVEKIPTTKSFDHLSTPPKKRKIPQNSTSSSHQIAFLQQNLDHNHKNLSCNLPPLHNQSPPRLSKEGQHDHNSDPCDQGRRQHDCKSCKHGKQPKNCPKKHRGIKGRPPI